MPKCPKIRMCGDDAAMVEITGNPRNAEPTHVRIVFPGGEVEVTRASDGVDADYWCHVRVLRPDDAEVVTGDGHIRPAHVTDGRIDVKGKHASESDAGDLENPDLYHLAVRVTRIPIATHCEVGTLCNRSACAKHVDCVCKCKGCKPE